MRGEIDTMMLGMMMLIIGILAVLFILRAQDPYNHPNVKALRAANDIASLLNQLQLQDGGMIEMGLGSDFRVSVEFREGEYFVGLSPAGGDLKEVKVALYPNKRDGRLEKTFLDTLNRVCIVKEGGYPEVRECEE